jgi:kexin
MTPTPDEGWFSDMSNLVSSQKWFFGAIGAVVLFGVGAGVFFWRRRVKHRAYAALSAGDDLPMSSVSRNRRPRARELYDAFGEVSDDEDADEESRLQAGGQTSEGLGFHSEFLDDDDPSPVISAPVYRDDPEKGHNASPDVRSSSPGSGSGDGSWEHASQTH